MYGETPGVTFGGIPGKIAWDISERNPKRIFIETSGEVLEIIPRNNS